MNSGDAGWGIRDPEGKTKKAKCRERPPHPPFSVPHSGGFTLIEVLLTVAILAVIMTVVYGSFSTASRNVKEAEKIRADTDLARTLLSRLCDDIANAYVNTAMNSPKAVTIFQGKEEELDGEGDTKIRHDSLDLTTLTNWRRPDTKESELWEVAYYFKEKPEGGGYSFMRREKRTLSQDAPAGDGTGDEYELTDRVQSLQLRYWNNGQWTDAWTMGGLPQAVEITLVLDTGDAYVTQVDIVSRPA